MKVQIFIDGGNFHHLALRPLGIKEMGFDFDAFAHFLADGRDISDMGKRYYIGTVREHEGDERSKQAMAKQVQLFNELKKTAWQIKTNDRLDSFPTKKTRRVYRFFYTRQNGSW